MIQGFTQSEAILHHPYLDSFLIVHDSVQSISSHVSQCSLSWQLAKKDIARFGTALLLSVSTVLQRPDFMKLEALGASLSSKS